MRIRVFAFAILLTLAALVAIPSPPPADAGDATSLEAGGGGTLSLNPGGQFIFWNLGPTEAANVFGTVKIAWRFDPAVVVWTSYVPALETVNFALVDGAVLWIVSEGAQTIAIGAAVKEEESDPPTEMKIAVVGPEELVFDWTTDRCEDEHIPDIAARAFRDAKGQVQLIIGHYVNYRMIGPELEAVVSDCSGPVLRSDFDPDPSQFNDSEWLASPYTEDGQTVYAIVHNEYRGVTHQSARPGQCPSDDLLTCLDTSMTMVISTDGGATYQDILPPPNHLVATLPYTFDDEGVPSGLRQPSNIVRGPDDYFYVFSNVSDYPETPGDPEPQWVCLMRTDDLSDPTAWRAWDGEDFTGRFTNPYIEPGGSAAETCAALALPQIGISLTDTLFYDEVLERYVLMALTDQPGTDERRWGVYYALSEDLINWTTRQLLLELPMAVRVADSANDLFYAYPSVMDPDSASLNFDTTDGGAYLYLARLNAGGNSLDRDLVRYPIEVQEVELTAPIWEFETEGDVEGWVAENQIDAFTVTGGSLSMESTGSDPYMVSPPVSVPASAFGRVIIRMKVATGGATQGQLFFVTDTDPKWDETKSIRFFVDAEGDFRNYALHMSDLPAWDGVVTQIRIDPVATPGAAIEIDSITFAD